MNESAGSDLQLNQILEQLAPLLGEPEGDPQPLEGGITNRNFRATLGGTEYVIRVPGKDTSLLEIDRQTERTANQAAAEAGVAPEVAAMLEDPPCLVTVFIEGREMSPEELRGDEALAEVGAALRRVHDCQDRLSTSFDSFRIVETYAETATGRGVELPAEYEAAHRRAGEIETALQGPEHEPAFCHNDLLAANFLRSPAGLRIVDWEYAGMGDRYFDLGNFAVNNELSPTQEEALLQAYWDQSTVGMPAASWEQRLASLRLMRFMSDFREAMWGVVQSAVSDLDFDFEGYAKEHFERLERTAADDRFRAWLEEAGGGQG